MSQYGRRCPHCGGTHIARRERGNSLGNSLRGIALFGIYGTWLGRISRRSLIAECLDCGHTWRISHEPPKEGTSFSGGVLVVVISLIAVWVPLLLLCRLLGFL